MCTWWLFLRVHLSAIQYKHVNILNVVNSFLLDNRSSITKVFQCKIDTVPRFYQGRGTHFYDKNLVALIPLINLSPVNIYSF